MRYRARAGQRVESEACAERQGTGRPERGERAGRRRRKDDDAEGGHSRTQTRRTRAKTRAPSSMSSSQTQSHRPRPDGVSRGGRASGRGRMASGGGTLLGVRVEARVCGRAARSQLALDQSFVFQSPKFRFVISLKATQISRNFRFAFLSRAQNESKFFLNTQSCTNRSSSRT